MKRNSTQVTHVINSLSLANVIAFRLITVIVMLLLAINSIFGQLSSGLPAKFGIDGDLKNDYRLSGTFTAAASDDWFKMNSGTGIGVIDTTGTGAFKSSLAAGNNIAFSKGLAMPRYSIQNGYMMVDAKYARDYFGTASGAASDLTTFAGGQKNGDNPSIWVTRPGGASVANKSDIIDAYVHLRRDGSSTTAPNPSHLFAIVGISTTSAIGDRFFDAEFFAAKVEYNSATGIFSNTAPALTGGHTAWQFNLDGTVRTFGDMSLAFDFSATAVGQMYALIWVSHLDWSTVTPKNFAWESGGYYGVTGGYGYARVKAKTGSAPVFGSLNNAITTSTPWGTTAQTLGTSTNNYYSLNYDKAGFGEAAIDLTALGIDQALSPNYDPCLQPYATLLFKSRSSSSFTSSLQDFAGPYQLDPPVPSSAINPPGKLTCSNTSVTLSVQSYSDGAYYYWTNADGSPVTNGVGSTLTVTTPGTYTLNSSAFIGCPGSQESVSVPQDIFKPKATAMASNMLSPSQPTATLMGGDTTASKYSNANGSYQGLAWSWSGPSSYSATVQNPTTSVPGVYTLIVTEISNGCKDTAMTNVLDKSSSVLAASKLTLTADKANVKTVKVNWILRGENASSFELLRSVDGSNFETINSVKADVTANTYEFTFADDVSAITNTEVMYKLKWVTAAGKVEFSNIVRVSLNNKLTSALTIFPNPVVSATSISFTAAVSGSATLQIIDLAGKVVAQQQLTVSRGSNRFMVDGLSALNSGVYTARINNGNQILTTRMLKVK